MQASDVIAIAAAAKDQGGTDTLDIVAVVIAGGAAVIAGYAGFISHRVHRYQRSARLSVSSHRPFEVGRGYHVTSFNGGPADAFHCAVKLTDAHDRTAGETEGRLGPPIAVHEEVDLDVDLVLSDAEFPLSIELSWEDGLHPVDNRNKWPSEHPINDPPHMQTVSDGNG